jgi:hypothetical protein
MFSRVCSVCGWWADGKVVEIFEGVGVRRAKVIADGELVEIAPLGAGELHLGDRVDLAWPRSAAPGRPREPIDCSELCDGDDHDPFSKW